MFNDNVLEILKWVAIGHEDDVLEYEDAIGQKCVFPYCSYDTSIQTQYGENLQHSENCLMKIARRELSESGHPLRKYVIDYKLTYTPTIEHKRKYPIFAEREDRSQQEIYYTIGVLKFNYSNFILYRQEKEQNRIDPDKEKFVVSMKLETIVIHDPIFLFGNEDDPE